ncbi:MAG: DNA polymerase IV, partial [Burkholderiaceae bacterium]
ERLRRLGADTCGDLRAWPQAELQRHFGKFGDRLFELCRGIDHRAVCPDRIRKSVSVEETYAADLPDLEACLGQLPALTEQLQARITRVGAAPFVHKLFVKIRFADFRKTSVECVAGADGMQPARFRELLATGFARGQQPVRLLGLGVRLEEGEQAPSQLGLFGDAAAMP